MCGECRPCRCQIRKDNLARTVLRIVHGLGNNAGTRYAILGPKTKKNNVGRRKRFPVLDSLGGILGLVQPWEVHFRSPNRVPEWSIATMPIWPIDGTVSPVPIA